MKMDLLVRGKDVKSLLLNILSLHPRSEPRMNLEHILMIDNLTLDNLRDEDALIILHRLQIEYGQARTLLRMNNDIAVIVHL